MINHTIDRAKVCYACQEYIPIIPSSPKNYEKVKLFEALHRGHTTQTIPLKEVKPNYRLYES